MVVEGQGGGVCGAMEGPELVTSLVGVEGIGQVKSSQVTSSHVTSRVRVRVHRACACVHVRACSMYVVREREREP